MFGLDWRAPRYERASIESWLKDHDTSPLTNETLSSKLLVPNRALKSLIDAHTL